MPTRTTGLTRYVSEIRYGSPSRSVDRNPTITTTPAVVLATNPDRVAFLLQNIGANTIFIGLTGGVNANTGMQVLVGSSVFVYQMDDDTLPSEQWYAIAIGGSSRAYIIETIADIIMAPEQR